MSHARIVFFPTGAILEERNKNRARRFLTANIEVLAQTPYKIAKLASIGVYYLKDPGANKPEALEFQ